jgi:hypothetical protein
MLLYIGRCKRYCTLLVFIKEALSMQVLLGHKNQDLREKGLHDERLDFNYYHSYNNNC